MDARTAARLTATALRYTARQSADQHTAEYIARKALGAAHRRLHRLSEDYTRGSHTPEWEQATSYLLPLLRAAETASTTAPEGTMAALRSRSALEYTRQAMARRDRAIARDPQMAAVRGVAKPASDAVRLLLDVVRDAPGVAAPVRRAWMRA